MRDGVLMINIENNKPDESSIGMAAAELHDLTKFWDRLSFSERDQSIVKVTDFLGKASLFSSDTITPNIGKMHEQIKFLSSSNHIEKQSKLKSSSAKPSSDLKSELKKPSFLVCMEIIHSLSPKELLTLGEYMGMNKARLSLIKPVKLHGMYEDTLTTRSTAIFFATRNYLGKHYM